MRTKQGFRLLIVDKDKRIKRSLKTALSAQGYNAFKVSGRVEALKGSIALHPDAMILDLDFPDKDGLNVIKEIRSRTKIPIIALSSTDREKNKVQALDAGADDYLVKPFKTGELLARLRAVMRRLVPHNESTAFKAGKLLVDIARHKVELRGQVLPLTPIEYDILKILILNAGKVVTQEQILKEVWDKTESSKSVAHLLRVTISNLRNKIEPNPDRPRYVLTEPGVGYRLNSKK